MKEMLRRPRSFVVALISGAVTSSCAIVLGLDEFVDQPLDPDNGTEDEVVCEPGVTRMCYAGPLGTENVGLCRAGAQTCESDASAWGQCDGEVVPRVEQCAESADEDCDSFDCVTWVMAYEQTGAAEVGDVAVDRDGNVILAGYFTGTIKIGDRILAAAGSTDAFVVKMDPAGAPLWGRQFGDALDDAVLGVALDSKDDIVVVARTSADVDFGRGPLPRGLVIAKLNSAGETIWSRGVGGDGYLHDVAVDADDDVIVVGATSAPVDFGSGAVTPIGGADVLVAKLGGASGSVVEPGSWVTLLGDEARQDGTTVAIDRSNNIFIGGYFQGAIDFGAFGGTVVGNGVDGFVAKLTPGGSVSWGRAIGGSGTQEVLGVAADESGSAVVVGEFDGSLSAGVVSRESSGAVDAFVLKYNATGVVLWGDSYGDSRYQSVKGVAVDGSGNILLSGYAGGEVDFSGVVLRAVGDLDGLLVKLSPVGDYLWGRLLGTVAEDVSWEVAVAPSSETVVAMTSRSDVIDFGTGRVPVRGNGSSRRVVVAKLGN